MGDNVVLSSLKVLPFSGRMRFKLEFILYCSLVMIEVSPVYLTLRRPVSKRFIEIWVNSWNVNFWVISVIHTTPFYISSISALWWGHVVFLRLNCRCFLAKYNTFTSLLPVAELPHEVSNSRTNTTNCWNLGVQMAELEKTWRKRSKWRRHLDQPCYGNPTLIINYWGLSGMWLHRSQFTCFLRISFIMHILFSSFICNHPCEAMDMKWTLLLS